MPLANCPRCGSLFNKLTIDCCKKCYDKEEELLRETQEFLRKNRNAAMFEVLEEVDVEKWMLEKWVADKRITLNSPEDELRVYHCSSCGREVKAGQTMCKTCQFKKLAAKKPPSSKLSEKSEKDATPTKSAGMHFKPR